MEQNSYNSEKEMLNDVESHYTCPMNCYPNNTTQYADGGLYIYNRVY